VSAHSLTVEAASLIEYDTLVPAYLKANIEYRIMNIECRVMYSARREPLGRTIYFIKKMKRSDAILHNSAVRYSIFCGSLFSRSTNQPFNQLTA
jgi:hypothetical protein